MIASGELLPLAMVSRYLLNKRENVSWTGRRRSWTDNLLRHHGCHALAVALDLARSRAPTASGGERNVFTGDLPRIRHPVG